jgi:hypothetical protein
VSRRPLSGAPTGQRHAALLDDLAAALDRLRVRLESSEAMPPALRSGLSAGLISGGVRLVVNGNADLVLISEFQLRPVRRDRDHFAFAEGWVSVQDGEGRVLGEFSENVREAATDAGLAEDRAVRALAGRLGRSLGAALLDVL